MSRYRKRPLIIEAWRWLFKSDQEPAPAWVSDALFKWPAVGGLTFQPDHPDGSRIAIATLDAIAIASPGDWICKGVKGELYPCKNDIFEELYESWPEVLEAPARATI